jgi:cytochrome c oxidase assembly factor CtaG
MATWQVIATAWDWDPTIALGCLALLAAYAFVAGFRFTRRALYFLLGDLVLLLALVSPIDVLGDYYLLSAHMLQHLLLVLVVPPLLLLGIPPGLWQRSKRWRLFRRCEHMLSQPAAAWLIGVLTLSIWHLPVLYEGALENENIHIVEHLCFIVSAVIFWYPAIVTEADRHLSSLAAMIYFNAAGMANTLLAILIAYSPHVLYSSYLQPQDPLGILSWIRDGWGLSAAGDQEIAGLMMWVPGSFPYLIASFAILIRWFANGDKEERQPEVGV